MKEKKQQKSKKKKGWDPLSLTVLLIALCVFVFSAYQLAMMMVPYYTGGEEYDEIKNLAIVSDKIGGSGRSSEVSGGFRQIDAGKSGYRGMAAL